MKLIIAAILGLATLASAHTTLTDLLIDGVNQGDGTCIRMPLDDDTATNPIRPVDGPDIACGRDGQKAVSFVCPAKKASVLTFTYRYWPSGLKPGSIDSGHLGPCAVYLKKVDNILTDDAAGDGWFKIWEDGYDEKTEKWCTTRLIDNNGLMSVRLPAGLPSGYYLVRPEILALHYAFTRQDPQYFVGCAQIFVKSDVTGPLEVPKEYIATIPSYVNSQSPSLTYNIYKETLDPYPMPGPKVYIPTVNNSSIANAEPKTAEPVQELGRIPADCVLKNANWCAKPVKRYTDEAACWVATKDCYEQSKACWGTAPPSGSKNCHLWSKYCDMMNNRCEAKNFTGPPTFKLKEVYTPLPGVPPMPWNDIFEEQLKGKVDEIEDLPTELEKAPVPTTTEATNGARAESTPPNRHYSIPPVPYRRYISKRF